MVERSRRAFSSLERNAESTLDPSAGQRGAASQRGTRFSARQRESSQTTKQTARGLVVGRITKVTDPSGSEVGKYGKLGEIVEETKTIASDTQGKSEDSPEVWSTSYEYDTWGRLSAWRTPMASC